MICLCPQPPCPTLHSMRQMEGEKTSPWGLGAQPPGASRIHALKRDRGSISLTVIPNLNCKLKSPWRGHPKIPVARFDGRGPVLWIWDSAARSLKSFLKQFQWKTRLIITSLEYSFSRGGLTMSCSDLRKRTAEVGKENEYFALFQEQMHLSHDYVQSADSWILIVGYRNLEFKAMWRLDINLVTWR